ncbi:MAG TPA: hypothetical protein VKT28_14170 [Puia sp.]|nr:hypothetical protein [Puia sp.]
MKSAFLLIAFCSVILISCKKDEVVYNAPASIEGTWDYIGFSGGLAGIPFTSTNAEGPYIQINGSQLLVTYNIPGQQKCMEYQFKKDTLSNPSYYQITGVLTTSDTSFILPMSNIKTYSVTLSNDTLTLYPSGCADCFTTVYYPTLKHFSCSNN